MVFPLAVHKVAQCTHSH